MACLSQQSSQQPEPQATDAKTKVKCKYNCDGQPNDLKPHKIEQGARVLHKC